MGDLIERLKEARADLLRGGGYFDDGFICQSIDMAIEALHQPRLPEGMEVTPDVADTFAIQYIDGRGIKHRGIVNAQKNFPFYNFLSAFLPSTKPETEKKETLVEAFKSYFCITLPDEGRELGRRDTHNAEPITLEQMIFVLRKLDERL